MTRKVKALALAFLAIAAIGGVTASAASAQGQIHIKDMGKLTGHATQSEPLIFHIPEGKLECPQTTFNIHTAYKLNAKGEQEDVETTATTFTVKAEEEKTPTEPETLHCKFAGIGGTIVHMNGCDFDIHINTLQATVTCPKEKQITITVIVAGVLKCTIHIHEQIDLNKLDTPVNNETTQDIKLTFTVEKITYQTTPGQGLGACKETNDGTDGQFTGTITVQGKAGGVASAIWHA
jgi:hypothetical protein